MKKPLFIITAMAFSVNLLMAKDIRVIETVMLPLDENIYMSPGFSPDGENVLFTQFGYKGLWLYNLQQNSIQQINDFVGAGYEPQFTSNGKQIIFRVDEYVKMRKYSALAIQTVGDKRIEYLSEKKRFISPVLTVGTNQVLAVEDKILKTYNLNELESAQALSSQGPLAYIEDQKIALISAGQKKILAPLGEGNYIWPSISPDKTQLLFTLAGFGTYVTDLGGNIISELGIARAPKWSPDGEWIVFMVDEDDGHRVTASDIWAVSKDGKARIRLTQTDDKMETYPNWSPKMDKIVFDTTDGKIGYLTIEVSE